MPAFSWAGLSPDLACGAGPAQSHYVCMESRKSRRALQRGR
ncbi:hypothetical protein NMD1_01300 [Novosphingobium sp. MD-1]|nr:hypothetical protein NMD1_01300 [Novosphingobium sp. MD-1]